MSREMRQRDQRAGDSSNLQVHLDPLLKQQVRKIGRIAQAINRLTGTLHNAAPEDWLRAVIPLARSMNDLTADFETTLQANAEQYIGSSARPPSRRETA